MLSAIIVTTLLVLLVVVIHYEALRLISERVARVPIAPRLRLMIVILGVFFAHTIEVWLFALGYYALDGRFGVGTFGGEFSFQFADYLYFSSVSYTSLGIGDVYPLGGMRLIAGVEALCGLLMIAWSASFTYLAMLKFWEAKDGTQSTRSGG